MKNYHIKFYNEQTDRSTYQEYTGELFISAKNEDVVVNHIKDNFKDQWHNSYQPSERWSETDNLALVTKSGSVTISEVKFAEVA